MRVLQLIDSLAVGGAERVAVNIANDLSQVKGVKSFLCSTRGGGGLQEALFPDVKQLILAKRSFYDWNSLFCLKAFVKEYNMDIVHAHSSSVFWAVLLRIFVPKLKVVWHNHNGKTVELPFSQQFPRKFFSLGLSAVLSVNEKLNQWAQEKLFVPASQMIYLPNYPALGKGEPSFPLHGVDGKRVVILANLRDPKNHHILVRAFKKVVDWDSDYTLHCFGKAEGDNYHQTLLSLIEELRLEDNVFIHGMHPNSFPYLKCCDIGVLASHYEGLPMALLEYGLAGLPVICTEVGECPKVLDGGKLGKLVPPSDVVAMEEALLNLLSNQELRNKFSISFKAKVAQGYSKTMVLQSLLGVYQGL